jgi:hypothetical protein
VNLNKHGKLFLPAYFGYQKQSLLLLIVGSVNPKIQRERKISRRVEAKGKLWGEVTGV